MRIKNNSVCVADGNGAREWAKEILEWEWTIAHAHIAPHNSLSTNWINNDEKKPNTHTQQWLKQMHAHDIYIHGTATEWEHKHATVVYHYYYYYTSIWQNEHTHTHTKTKKQMKKNLCVCAHEIGKRDRFECKKK